MKILVSILATALTAATTLSAFASQTYCPDGSAVQFVQKATPYVGYWHGKTTDNRELNSAPSSIAHNFLSDGYKLVFNNEIDGTVPGSGTAFVSCGYKVIDVKTGVIGTLAKLSTTIQPA